MSGAAPWTLLRRTMYGGRKGRRALRRLQGREHEIRESVVSWVEELQALVVGGREAIAACRAELEAGFAATDIRSTAQESKETR